MDPTGDPGQCLAPGMGNAACHGPAAIPGEDRVPTVPSGAGRMQG